VPRLLQASAGLHLDISAHNLLIALADAGPLTMTALARQLGTDLSTVSRQVLQPESAGLIGRMPSLSARSGQTLHLTARGEDVADRLIDAWNDLMDPVLKDWSDDEVLQFSAHLARFVSGLEERVKQRLELTGA